jgi:small ligand-binding sensory domain FIST
VPFAVAASEHPVPALATGEVIGGIIEQLGAAPDLAMLFVTVPHAGALDDIVATVDRLVEPGALIGCVADSVVAGAREIEDQPAVVLWAGRLGSVSAHHLDVVTGPGGASLGGLPEPGTEGTLVLLADPHTFPTGSVLDLVADQRPDLTLVGGLVAPGRAPGTNRLVLDGRVHGSGAVAVFLPHGVPAEPIVSQGCRPIGDPLTVTAAEGNVVAEIAGRPAAQRLREALATVPDGELEQTGRGIQIGRVVDDHKLDFDRGDFLVRAVLAGDTSTGALTVGDRLAVGDTVQFQLRDAQTADEDLRLLLDGRGAAGALLFTCNGRGHRLFGRPDHDAEVVTETLGTSAVAGMFCAGEIGPIGGRSFVHGYTASALLLDPF